MNTNFNEQEYFVMRLDLSSENTPIIDWKTSSRKFLYPVEINANELKLPLELVFGDPCPRKLLMYDILYNSGTLIISEKFKLILEKSALPKLQFFPISILNKKKESIGGYYICHCYNAIAAVDKNNYEGDPVNEDGEIFDLKRFMFDKDVLNKIPMEERLLFCLAEDYRYTIMHQSVMDAIKNEEITGVIFYNVSSWATKS